MSANILSGIKARDARLPILTKKIGDLSRKPVLAIIQIGQRSDSTSYIKAKKRFADHIGVEVRHINISEDQKREDILAEIEKCNLDDDIDGIIVQLPLPEHLDRQTIIDSIDPRKDVDALTSSRVKAWSGGNDDAFFPATARGVRELLEYYNISLRDKRVAVIGRSMLVGAPIASMCRGAGAQVSVGHSKTTDGELIDICRSSDIIIVAVGKPKVINASHVKAGHVIVDIGINTIQGEKLDDEIEGRRLVGDVDFDVVYPILGDQGAITPVPGGVGPMTVLGLFENLIEMIDDQSKNRSSEASPPTE